MVKRMKVAYMFGSMNRGGAETIMLDVFRNWQNAPFSFIGIHRKGGAYQEDFYAAGPALYQLAPMRCGYVRYLIQLRKLLKSENINIVHTQHWLDCIYAYIATIGTKIRLVNTFHGFYSMKGLNGRLCRLSIHMADDVCYVSRYEQEWYQKQMRIEDKKCHVIYNGIDFSKIDSAKPSLEFANLPQRIRLAMVGNFVSGRSQNIIAKSIHVLREKGITNFEFYFIGRRDDKETWHYDECVKYCEKHKLDNVYFLGNRGDVPSLLKTIDGFIYSTDHDTFGIAIVEAMVAGLPVVVNDWPVMKEVCGDVASYFRSKEAEDCANALEKLLAELPQRKYEAKSNAEIIRNKYAINCYIDTLAKIYENSSNR